MRDRYESGPGVAGAADGVGSRRPAYRDGGLEMRDRRFRLPAFKVMPGDVEAAEVVQLAVYEPQGPLVESCG